MSVSPEHVPTSPLATELPALRLLPVPTSEPPYDDELERHGSARSAPPSPRRSGRVPLRLVLDEDDEPGPGGGTDPHDDRYPSGLALAAPPPVDLPPVRPAAHALVQGLLEVLAGVRPVLQLQRATSSELFEELQLRVHSRPRTAGSRPRTGAVRSLHVQERAAVAEVCARVDRDGRSAAVALRLEGRDGQWRCTQLTGL